MTDLDRITPELLEQTLRSLRQAEDPPEQLLDLYLLNLSGPSNRAERILRLEDILRAMVVKMLTDQRKLQGLAGKHRALTLRKDWLDSVAADFQSGNVELEAWSAVYHRYLTPVSLSVEELASGAGVVPQQFRRRLNQGLKFLTVAIRREEMKAAQHQPERLLRYIPASEFNRLYGFDTVAEQVNNLLVDPVGPPLISIEGIGGSGKTALAIAIAYHRAALGGLADILWVCQRTAPQMSEGPNTPLDCSVDATLAVLGSQMSFRNFGDLDLREKILQLRPALIRSPYLVVIDNIGPQTDLALLVNTLSQLVGETRVLLLSRVSLQRYANVRIQRVPELDPGSTKQIIADELARRGYSTSLTEAEFERVYALLGGNPLVNKMLAGHIGRFSIDDVLTVILQAQGHAATALYEHIFKDSWQDLSEGAKQVARLLQTYKGVPVDLTVLSEAMALPVLEVSYLIGELTNHYFIESRQEEKLLTYRLTRLARLLMSSRMTEQW